MTDCASMADCPLFDGVSPEDFPGLLDCLGARRMTARKGQIILAEGSPARDVGILLSGRAQLIRTDYYGNRSIMLDIVPGQLFAESFACSHAQTLERVILSRLASWVCDRPLCSRSALIVFAIIAGPPFFVKYNRT